jgi:hypothetical protein
LFRFELSGTDAGDELAFGRLSDGEGRSSTFDDAFFRNCSTGFFISPSGISELDCATTKTDTAERSISIGRESLQVVFFVLGALAYFQIPPLGGSREENRSAKDSM